MKLLLLGVLGIAFLVMNPFYLGGDEYTYDVKDLRDAVEGTWVLETPDRRVTLQIEQASEPARTGAARPLVPAAYACSERTLIRPAHACIRRTTMPLVVRTARERGHGTLDVFGRHFDTSMMYLRVEDVEVTARIRPDGTATDVRGGAMLRRL